MAGSAHQVPPRFLEAAPAGRLAISLSDAIALSAALSWRALGSERGSPRTGGRPCSPTFEGSAPAVGAGGAALPR